TWPKEYFIELIARLTAENGPLPAARVAVFCAAGEEHIARPVLDSVPSERRIDMTRKASISQSVTMLARCTFYVGNDSGLTHCAAAAGVKTLGLFGPTRDEHYRPWGKNSAFVRTPES